MDKEKRALIVGITGQDGAYLAELLLDKGYRVFGTSRDVSSCDRQRLRWLKVDSRVQLVSMLLEDFRSVPKHHCEMQALRSPLPRRSKLGAPRF